jgi:branched-chain amino acid transport system ATP-binding protein
MLEVSNLEASYGDTVVLRGIHLEVPKAARVAVLGRNGAGKSSLLKSLMNAGPTTSGRIMWNRVDLAGQPPAERSRLGMCLVPEDRRIFPNLTVLENIVIGRTPTAKNKSWTPRSLLRTFPILEPLTGRMGDQLSGGQQQMLAIARGFAGDPKLLMLDEPTEGLAPVIVQQLAKSVVEAIDSTGSSLILCEQNISFARRCTTQVLVINTGQIVFRGDWAAFDADPSVKETYLAV